MQAPDATVTREWPKLVRKADGLFRIAPKTFTSLSGNKQALILEHRTGRDNGEFSGEDLFIRLGLRDEFNKEDQELEKLYKTKNRDPETYKEKRDKARNGFISEARHAITDLIDKLEGYYEPQGIKPCGTWLPTYVQGGNGGWKKSGSVFYIQCFVHTATGDLAWGEQPDYANYHWAIKKATQRATEKNQEVTQNMVNYLKSGKANKEVSHFLSTCLKSDIGSVPLLGFSKADETK